MSNLESLIRQNMYYNHMYNTLCIERSLRFLIHLNIRKDDENVHIHMCAETNRTIDKLITQNKSNFYLNNFRTHDVHSFSVRRSSLNNIIDNIVFYIMSMLENNWTERTEDEELRKMNQQIMHELLNWNISFGNKQEVINFGL